MIPPIHSISVTNKACGCKYLKSTAPMCTWLGYWVYDGGLWGKLPAKAVGPTQLASQWVAGTFSRGTFPGLRHWSRTSTHCRGWECVGATSPLPHWPSWRNALLSTVQFTLTYSVWLTFHENNVINNLSECLIIITRISIFKMEHAILFPSLYKNIVMQFVSYITCYIS
jgi:hypothetical protein